MDRLPGVKVESSPFTMRDGRNSQYLRVGHMPHVPKLFINAIGRCEEMSVH